MKRIILVGAIAMLAACGSTKNEASGGAGTSDTSAATPVAGSDDTITVDNFGDMPPKCIELLGQFLKKIEPTVSKIDWDKATLGDFNKFGEQFKTESDSFDADSTAAGCNKYNLTGSDDKQIEQMTALASVEAPGTVGFIKFLGSLSASATAAGSIPTDCAGTIAAIEPFLAGGKTMQDLTVAQVTQLGPLMTGISTNCSADEASAFFARTDVTAFVGA
ncbi:MAG: hypothetical protein QOE09_3765 [Ilumatobacteraceae bacterium]|jgi:hypothetical protein